jgi:hypothetical protein
MLQDQQHAHSQSVGGESVLNQYQRPGVQQSVDFRNAGVAQSSSVNMLQPHMDSISASQAAGGNLPASATNAQSHAQLKKIQIQNAADPNIRNLATPQGHGAVGKGGSLTRPRTSGDPNT